MTAATDLGARFEINPRDYSRDKAYIGGLTIWGVLMLSFSIACIYWEFWVGAIFGGVLFLAVVPYALSQRNRCDLFQVNSDFVVVSKGNPKGAGIRLHRKNPLEITIEHVEDSASDAGIESTSTLNLWDVECGYRRRTILGLWISEEAKAQVLKDLVDFLRQHDFEVDCRNKVDKTKAE